MDEEVSLRQSAIHLLRSGKRAAEVAQELNRSVAWVYKWWQRYRTEGEWAGLVSRSRAPRHCPTRLNANVRQAIRQARSALEAAAQAPGELTYIGSHAIRARLRQIGLSPLPSISSIERELRAAGMTHPKCPPPEVKTTYPHLQPSQPHELVQVDIVPRHLPGGSLAHCFNAIDVVSRYPTGQQYGRKRAADAVQFLWHVWQDLGVPRYTQVDNESCFSGGPTHPAVLGKVVRLALLVGTELVFSPIHHPESNGYVERFHQDYTQNVWDKQHLPDLLAVQQCSPAFFAKYRHSGHHSALRGSTPAQVHARTPARARPTGFHPVGKLPLCAGRVHFIRQVSADGHVALLNQRWAVPRATPTQGVWVTLDLRPIGAHLRVYDDAPDAPRRTCLVVHPFPLKEPVSPLPTALCPTRRVQEPRFFFAQLARFTRTVVHWVSTMS